MCVKIQDLEVGQVIRGFYLIKSKDVRTGSNGKYYIDYYFTDTTGVVNGKHWSPENDQFDFETGQIVKIEATVNEFNMQKQLKVQRIRLATPKDDIVLEEIIPCAPYPATEMYEEIMGYIHQIGDEDIRKVVQTIFEGYKEPLMYYPAAKSNHHSIMAGLLYHELRMLRTGEAVCTIYPYLNRDLVYAGVILHDLEKINEMHADQYGVVDHYTVEGNLLGHIVLGVVNVSKIAETLGVSSEKALILQHLILSHHYEPEFGSPVKPAIPEGEVLHHLDMIDARMYDMENALRNVDDGEFSEPIYSLDRRRIYKPGFGTSGIPTHHEE